jgi:hypothetical protein
MSLDIHQFGARHCYACIQWDGKRAVDLDKKVIRADVVSEGRCLVKHADVKGTHYCDLFFPIK